MNTVIYLVRHAQCLGNIEGRLAGRAEFDVTEKGKEQIAKLTDRLKDIKFDEAYSSSSVRAIKTIKPLAELNKIKIEKTDELCEMSFGIYDGWKWADVNTVAPQIKQAQDEINEIMGIPEQESTEVVANRMYNYIEKIATINKGKTILMASHGVAIEAFIKKVNNETFLENKEKNSQKNTAVNIVEYNIETKTFKVLELNDISHLED